MQQGGFITLYPRGFFAFMAAPFMAFALWLTYLSARFVRSSIVRRLMTMPRLTTYSPVSQDENAEATFGDTEAIEKWEETIYDAENDVSALTFSFLSVQAIRFTITSYMPDTMGNEPEHYLHDVACIRQLAICAFLFLVATVTMVVVTIKAFQKGAGGEED